MFVGYDAHLACPVAPVGSRTGCPSLIIGFVLTPAGSHKGLAGLRVIDSLRRRDHSPARVLSDRGYTYLKPEWWALALAARGVEQALDLHPAERGVRPGPRPGTIMIDGTPYSDAIPTRLRRLGNYTLGMPASERVALQNLYDERLPYAFMPMGKPDGTRQRYRGPARAGRLRCPNNPASMRRDPRRYRTTSCNPGCACGTTVTLHAPEHVRLRQRHPYGGTDWFRDYYRRVHIESGNSLLKTPLDCFARGAFRARSRPSISILLAFKIAAVNMQIIDSLDPAWTPPRAPRQNRRPVTTLSNKPTRPKPRARPKDNRPSKRR